MESEGRILLSDKLLQKARLQMSWQDGTKFSHSHLSRAPSAACMGLRSPAEVDQQALESDTDSRSMMPGFVLTLGTILTISPRRMCSSGQEITSCKLGHFPDLCKSA